MSHLEHQNLSMMINDHYLEDKLCPFLSSRIKNDGMEDGVPHLSTHLGNYTQHLFSQLTDHNLVLWS